MWWGEVAQEWRWVNPAPWFSVPRSCELFRRRLDQHLLYLAGCFHKHDIEANTPRSREAQLDVVMSQFKGNLRVRDFKVSIPDQDLEDFKNLLKLSKIGPETFENSCGDASYGLSRSWVSQAKDRWLNGYDW
jgi:hypothetical protein